MQSPDKARVTVFDTTLRDGDQAGGRPMTVEDKRGYAQIAADMNVDVLEAGFARAREVDFQSIREIGSDLRGRSIVICSLARCIEEDIVQAAGALETADHPRLHIFLASSDIHRQASRKHTTPDEYLDAVSTFMERAKRNFDDIEFSPEDAFRTDPDFLVQIGKRVAEAGKDRSITYNVPDTVGYARPADMQRIFGKLYEEISAVREGRMALSAHNHNDLGLATINSLTALEAMKDARKQVEVTMNGIGERAGNTAFEEVVMNQRVHPQAYPHFHFDHIDATKFMDASRFVSQKKKVVVPRNKSIVGGGAFSHGAGIHGAKFLTNSETYQIMCPEDVGQVPQVPVAPHSGKGNVRNMMEKIGYDVPVEDLVPFTDYIVKQLERNPTDSGEASEEDMHRFAYEFFGAAVPTRRVDEHGKPVPFLSTSKNGHWEVELHVDVRGKPETWEGTSESGQGIFQATSQMLKNRSGTPFEFLTESQKSISSKDNERTASEATVVIRVGETEFTGIATSTDIDESYVRALLDAVNKSRLPRQH